MTPKVCPALAEFHAKNSHDSQGKPRQLRLPLMAREIGPSGDRLRNVPAVEELRIFLVTRSNVPAKLIARGIESRPIRVFNEDEGRVLLTGNVIVGRFLTLSDDDAEEFIERLRAVRA